jgi:hypothetical protein
MARSNRSFLAAAIASRPLVHPVTAKPMAVNRIFTRCNSPSSSSTTRICSFSMGLLLRCRRFRRVEAVQRSMETDRTDTSRIFWSMRFNASIGSSIPLFLSDLSVAFVGTARCLYRSNSSVLFARYRSIFRCARLAPLELSGMSRHHARPQLLDVSSISKSAAIGA